MTNSIYYTDLGKATGRTLDLLCSGVFEKQWGCTSEDLVDIITITDAIDYIEKHYEVLVHMEEKQLANELARYTLSQIPALVTRVQGYSSAGLGEPPFVPDTSAEASALEEQLALSNSQSSPESSMFGNSLF